jgi:undecaprenyl diphosphate synthase
MAVPALHEDLPPPQHVAIIMDGNGRWAIKNSLPRSAGHRKGSETVRMAVESCCELGIPYLTLFAFSSENWKRPKSEIKGLMGLLRFYLEDEVEKLLDAGVRLRVIGDRNGLENDIQELISSAEARTKANDRLNLIMALNYGGRREILLAIQNLVADINLGKVNLKNLDEIGFGRYLETSEVPDPDLLIRTSGERRISNFLLWQCAYSEFVFVDTLWPDFNKKDFSSAIKEFHERDRRYGGTRN